MTTKEQATLMPCHFLTDEEGVVHVIGYLETPPRVKRELADSLKGVIDQSHESDSLEKMFNEGKL
jgi:hypothetical protein